MRRSIRRHHAQGRVRLRVDAEGSARVEFLDGSGKVVRSIAP